VTGISTQDESFQSSVHTVELICPCIRNRVPVKPSALKLLEGITEQPFASIPWHKLSPFARLNVCLALVTLIEGIAFRLKGADAAFPPFASRFINSPRPRSLSAPVSTYHRPSLTTSRQNFSSPFITHHPSSLTFTPHIKSTCPVVPLIASPSTPTVPSSSLLPGPPLPPRECSSLPPRVIRCSLPTSPLPTPPRPPSRSFTTSVMPRVGSLTRRLRFGASRLPATPLVTSPTGTSPVPTPRLLLALLSGSSTATKGLSLLFLLRAMMMMMMLMLMMLGIVPIQHHNLET
jgi:hypothetical protein